MQRIFQFIFTSRRSCERFKYPVLFIIISIGPENFESPHVKVHMAKWASEVMSAPDYPGTGLTMYLILGLGHKYAMATVVGVRRVFTNPRDASSSSSARIDQISPIVSALS